MSHAQEQALLEALNEHHKTRRHVPDFYGIPLGEFHMLKLIETMMEENANSEAGVQASQLSVRSQISRSAVSQILNSLEKKDLIERVVGEPLTVGWFTSDSLLTVKTLPPVCRNLCTISLGKSLRN